VLCLQDYTSLNTTVAKKKGEKNPNSFHNRIHTIEVLMESFTLEAFSCICIKLMYVSMKTGLIILT
jgi:hypothetical protein